MRFLIDSVSGRRRRAAGAMWPVVLLAVAVSGALPVQAQPGLPPSMAGSNQVSMIGVFRGAAGQVAAWFVDSNGDYQYETSDQVMSFGLGGDLPIVGDWNNNGQLNIGVFRDGYWYLDLDGNGAWDGGDSFYAFGQPGDIPVVGDWTHNGTLRIGVYRVDSSGQGWWYVNLHTCTDRNGYGCQWGGQYGSDSEIQGVDYDIYQFGLAGDQPVVGDWDHTGNLRIGVFRSGTWIVDMGGCNCYGSGAATYSFGEPGDQAVVGRWALGSDATHLNMGVLRAGMWYVDANGSGGWDGGDAIYSYGLAGDIPVMGTVPAGASQQPLSITSGASLPGGTVSAAYSQQLAASGGVAPYTWSVTSGSPPAGLTLSTGGTLSGTPTAAGSSTFTVQVTDSSSASATKQFNVTVNPASAPAPPAASPGPPSAPPSSCGTPDCLLGWTAMTWVPPNTFFGTAYSQFTGPDASYFVSYASANMQDNTGADLGSECPNQAGGFQVSATGGAAATAVSPCGNNNRYYATANASHTSYTVAGTHYGTNVASVFYSHASLGFVPAGASWDFQGLPQDPFSDFRTASAPVANPADVSASYTGNTQNTVSVLINAPYTAQKGAHVISFPTQNIYGNPAQNSTLLVVVYDPTPKITTVSPSPLPTGTTTLTISGYGFGTHPTVYVNGTAYTTTGLSQHSPGQDQVMVTVTLSNSLAGSNIPIYLVSNGAGAPFSGSPEGSAHFGSATSNTVRAPATLPPPVITAMCSPPQNPCPAGATATLQVGTTDIPFEIDGSNFTAYTPTSLTGSCVANVFFIAYDDHAVNGTLDVPANATAGPCTVTFTPAGMSQSATYVVNLIPGPPTVSGSQGIWYLGSAPYNDNCDPNNLQNPSCYYNSTQLSLALGPGGTAPSASSPAVWSLTDPASGQSPTFASFVCVDQPCSMIKITATSPPSYCVSTGNVHVQVTLAGVASSPFSVVVDWPQSTILIATSDIGIQNQARQQVGYLSVNTLKLASACGSTMFNMAWHEEFPTNTSGVAAPFNACNQSQGWTDPVPLSGWAAGTTDAGGILTGDPLSPGGPPSQFDGIGMSCGGAAPCTPAATIPGPFNGQPLGTTPEAWQYQFIFVGSKDTQILRKYWPAAPNKQVLYTDHGRDESGTWSCPVQ